MRRLAAGPAGKGGHRACGPNPGLIGPGEHVAGGSRMAFEALKAEVGLLLTQMQNEPEDRHELYFQIMERLNTMKAVGMPLPEDLVRLEAALEAEFAADKRES